MKGNYTVYLNDKMLLLKKMISANRIKHSSDKIKIMKNMLIAFEVREVLDFGLNILVK